MEIDVLKQVTDIVCHDNCSDGTLSAILLLDALPGARVHFCSYGLAQEKLEAREGMLFCDFSPHADTCQRFLDAGAVVLDHHRTAASIVAKFGDRGVFADENIEPGVSGAVLAYRHVWLPLKQEQWRQYKGPLAAVTADLRNQERQQAETLSRLIGIRDTWQKNDPDWEQACALAEGLRFFGQENWLTILEPFAADRGDFWKARIGVGSRLVEKHAETLQRLAKGAYRFTSHKGTRVVMFQGVSFTSDACELVRKGNEADLVVGFDHFPMEGGQAPLVFSTRATGDTFDCAGFCKAQGGGGHTKAAGFSIRFDPAVGTQDPYSLLRARLKAYEASAVAA